MCLLFVLQAAMGQSFTGDSIVSLPQRPGVYRLIGHVRIEHGGNRIFSDFADYDQKTGSCQAYDNLRIYTAENVYITGEVLDYDGATGSYVVDRNVVLKDGEMTMETPSLLYEGLKNRAYYRNGGHMVSGETELTSLRGFYDGRTEMFNCFDSVVIVNPDYTIWTDSLYYSKKGLTRFKGHTDIETSDYLMYGGKGWFNQDENKVSLQKDAYVKTKTTQTLFGDSIYYDLGRKSGQVFGNVFIQDTLRNCYLAGDYAENDEGAGYAMITQGPRGVMVENGDSLFVAGDTMIMTYDTARHIRELFVYHGVKFFREGIQGKCDSLSYIHADTLMQLFYEPMVWLQGYQIDGDSIKVWFSDNRPHHVLIQENAFVTTPVSAGQHYYNQVKGRRIWGYFNDSSEFRLAHVVGGAQSVYYVLGDKPDELLGVNKTESQSLKMYFKENTVNGITVVQPSKTALYPVGKLTRRERTLRGFHWKPEHWPQSKFDVSPVWW
ncbi:MAG: hypothetical protein NC048_06530 [Bacteroides sp.]|nr:hypothetical protein [Ruminococcus flavefaciens]MCM1555134.1 hypothetical protein [Bacteroides sp.]